MLKTRCDRDELTDAFGAILGIVPSSQPLKPVLVNFHLVAKDGHLLIEATDLDIGARVRVERVDILEEGELALPAQRLAALVREVPKKELLFEALSDRNGALVQAEGYEFHLLGEDPSQFPEIPSFSTDDAVMVAREKFTNVLRRVAVAASRDAARYQLTGVYCELDDDKFLMTATDGKRLTHDYFRLDGNAPVKARGIIPNRAIDVLLKLLPQGDDDFRLVLGESDLHVRFGRGELTCKLIQGAFPDYEVAVKQEAKVKIKARRSEFLTAARSAALMTDKETSTVIFSFEGDKVSLSTQARDIGESRIEIPIDMQGPPMEIRFNPAYFIDALRCVTEEEVRIELADPSRPGAVRGGQHYKHMLMPLVVSA